jgi:hypothetical protein
VKAFREATKIILNLFNRICLTGSWPVIEVLIGLRNLHEEGEVITKTCHQLVIGEKQRIDRDRWQALVEDMVDKGAKLTEQEVAEAVDYLAGNFGPPKSAPPK